MPTSDLTAHIDKSTPVETHPLAPFVMHDARLLMLGSFPPAKTRWCMNFYYPNFQNDMWRIFGLVFFADKNHFIDINNKTFNQSLIEDFLIVKKIAIYDSAEQVIRLKNNASDQFLQIVQATDIIALLQRMPQCDYLLTTGDKATDTLLSVLPEGTVKPTLQVSTTAMIHQRTINLYRLPSSSRAYPLALEKKAAAYADFFSKIGLL